MIFVAMAPPRKQTIQYPNPWVVPPISDSELNCVTCFGQSDNRKCDARKDFKSTKAH